LAIALKNSFITHGKPPDFLFSVPYPKSHFSRLSTGEAEINPQDSGFGRPAGRPKGERQGWRESKCRKKVCVVMFSCVGICLGLLTGDVGDMSGSIGIFFALYIADVIYCLVD